LSIRWRLTLWNTLALAVVLLGFAALVYGLVHHALYAQVDRKLLSGLQQLDQGSLAASDRDERLRHWIYELQEHDGVFCTVYDAGGQVLHRTQELAADSVPEAPQGTSSQPVLRDTTVPIIGRQRTLATGLRLGGREATVLLMAPLEEVDHELREVLTAISLAVPVALVFAGGLAYGLARKALAPVDDLRRQTQQITADRLDRRLPITNPRDELGRLTSTINEMISRLERSFAEIRRFTADASHELRTPLTAIRTEAEVAMGKPAILAEHQHLLGSILEECDRLTRLSDQLLALSREDAGVAQQVRKPVELAVLVRGVVENMRPLAEAKAIDLHVESNGSLDVHGDESRLRQVFYNLLDNAIKYTAPAGRIEVQVGREGRAAVAVVRDTGIGISEEHLPFVFDRFYRVDKARSRAQGGTGLGLSIVKSIVTAHGGEIELTSAPGQGTTCKVTLPEAPDEV
jgi:heavy metal sensor kinase